MLQSGEWASEIGVLEQRAPGAWNLNTFLRWSHYDAEREADRRYEEDSRAGAWAHGDFAGHCSGLSQLRRAMCMGALLVTGCVQSLAYSVACLALFMTHNPCTVCSTLCCCCCCLAVCSKLCLT